MVSTYVRFYLKGVSNVYVYMQDGCKNVGKIRIVLARALPRCLRILFRNQSYRSSAHDFLFVFVFFSWAALTFALLHKGSPTMRTSRNNGALRCQRGKRKRNDWFVSFSVD